MPSRPRGGGGGGGAEAEAPCDGVQVDVQVHPRHAPVAVSFPEDGAGDELVCASGGR